MEKDGNNEGPERPITALFGESMFQNTTPNDADGTSNVFVSAEFGITLQDSIDAEVVKTIDEAVAEGLPEEKKDSMKNIWFQ